MCIGGLQDLDSKVTLLTGKRVTVRELLKSFPPSPGMSHPVFFQEVENNSSGQVVIVSYQKTDAPLVKKRYETIESDIKKSPAEGQPKKGFLDEVESMWFGSVFKIKVGASCLGTPPLMIALNMKDMITNFSVHLPKNGSNVLPCKPSQYTQSTHHPRPRLTFLLVVILLHLLRVQQ